MDYFGAFAFSEWCICPILRCFFVGVLVYAALDIVPMMVCLYGVFLRWDSSLAVLFRR